MRLFSRARAKDEPAKTGRIVTIPKGGRAAIVSDLHGHKGDFDAFVARSRVFDRISNGENLWLLITGDVPDLVRHRGLDPEVPEDGDIKILDALLYAQKELGPRGARIIYLEGNHDFHILRIAREVALFDASKRGRPAAPAETWTQPVDPEAIDAYFAHYKKQYGEEVFENNITPYDMIRRVEPRHLAFLAEGPILGVLEGGKTLVTHAGPARMAKRTARSVRREVEGATRESLRDASPEAYYASAYHQLLNGRFRSQDYEHSDIEAFLGAFGANLLVTGHTPHAYLVDYARSTPLEGCTFRHGLGLVGDKQVVLCTSFGAFDKARKKYVELDLERAYGSAHELGAGTEVHPIYPEAPLPEEGEDETRTILRALARQARNENARQGDGQRPTRHFDPHAVTEAD